MPTGRYEELLRTCRKPLSVFAFKMGTLHVKYLFFILAAITLGARILHADVACIPCQD